MSEQYQASMRITRCMKCHDADCMNHMACHLFRLAVASWSIARVLISSLSLALFSVDLEHTYCMEMSQGIKVHDKRQQPALTCFARKKISRQ